MSDTRSLQTYNKVTWYRSIRTKISIIFSLLIAIISLFIFLYFPAKQEEKAIESLIAKASSIIEMTSFNISTALYFEDVETINETFESAKQNNDLKYIILSNENGIISSYNIFNAANLDDSLLIQSKNLIIDAEYLHILRPINFNGNQIGKMQMGFSLENLKELTASSRTTIAIISLILFVSGLVVVLVLSLILTKPLFNMVETVNKISKGGLSHRATIYAKDEVGLLSNSFNNMLDYLESAQLKRKKIEIKRDQLLKEIKSANKDLENFAYVVSHDLKAPLRAIGSLTDWLVTDYSEKLGEAGRELIELMLSRTKRMYRLIDGILNYSRLGRIKEQKINVDLNKSIKNVIKLISPPDNFDIEVAELPTVYAEKIRMEQVLQNLLSNSIKYMDKAKGEIKVGCVSENGHWKVSVSDNGPGIEERYFTKIFQIFQTLNARDEFESTGVGLSLVKKIIELYGGEVNVQSRIGEGTTFTFTLPRNKEIGEN